MRAKGEKEIGIMHADVLSRSTDECRLAWTGTKHTTRTGHTLMVHREQQNWRIGGFCQPFLMGKINVLFMQGVHMREPSIDYRKLI